MHPQPTAANLSPTLGDYARTSRSPFDKAELIHWLVIKNLQRTINRGHGNQARRRMASL